MKEYLIVNAYGDLIMTCDTYRDAIRYLEEYDNEDNKGYRIEIVEKEEDNYAY